MPKFENVSCSQCGQSFGPGDSGYSHCDQHAAKPHPWKDVPAQYKRERWGAFLAVMLISKSPKSSKQTAFVSGESVKGLEIEDNRSSASTFVQLKEAENISVRRNTHEPK